METSNIPNCPCPLRYQTGEVAIVNFAMLLDQLSDDLRSAFEAERAERQCEFDIYMASNEYCT